MYFLSQELREIEKKHPPRMDEQALIFHAQANVDPDEVALFPLTTQHRWVRLQDSLVWPFPWLPGTDKGDKEWEKATRRSRSYHPADFYLTLGPKQSKRVMEEVVRQARDWYTGGMYLEVLHPERRARLHAASGGAKHPPRTTYAADSDARDVRASSK